MRRLIHPLLMVIAQAIEKELVLYIEYLKAENRILRSKLPKRIDVTPAERSKLIKLGVRLGPAIKELTDSGAESEICALIEKISLDTEGVLDVHKCRTRHLGFGLQVDLHVKVKQDLTVLEGHDISEQVKSNLIEQVSSVVDVITHLEPFLNGEESEK